jgi:type IV secretory pathway VirB10-like protein
MRHASLCVIVLLAASLGACAAKAQTVTVEPELPALDPPPPPPRVVAVYEVEEEEPEPPPVVPTTEKPAAPPRPAPRPPRTENRVDPPRAEVGKPVVPPLVLAPKPGSELQTEAAIRDLLARVAKELSRVNVASLGGDGKTQFETAQRFLQQAEEALKGKNLVFAGKLADKAATLASVFVR